MAKKRRLRKLAAFENSNPKPVEKKVEKKVALPTPPPAEEQVEEAPKKTRRLWSRKASSEE